MLKQVLFKDAIGKTISKVTEWAMEDLFVVFTDSTFAHVTAESEGYRGEESASLKEPLLTLKDMGPCHVTFGLLTAEELAAAKTTEAEQREAQRREAERQQYLKLKAIYER